MTAAHLLRLSWPRVNFRPSRNAFAITYFLPQSRTMRTYNGAAACALNNFDLRLNGAQIYNAKGCRPKLSLCKLQMRWTTYSALQAETLEEEGTKTVHDDNKTKVAENSVLIQGALNITEVELSSFKCKQALHQDPSKTQSKIDILKSADVLLSDKKHFVQLLNYRYDEHNMTQCIKAIQHEFGSVPIPPGALLGNTSEAVECIRALSKFHDWLDVYPNLVHVDGHNDLINQKIRSVACLHKLGFSFEVIYMNLKRLKYTPSRYKEVHKRLVEAEVDPVTLDVLIPFLSTYSVKLNPQNRNTYTELIRKCIKQRSKVVMLDQLGSSNKTELDMDCHMNINYLKRFGFTDEDFQTIPIVISNDSEVLKKTWESLESVERADPYWKSNPRKLLNLLQLRIEFPVNTYNQNN